LSYNAKAIHDIILTSLVEIASNGNTCIKKGLNITLFLCQLNSPQL